MPRLNTRPQVFSKGDITLFKISDIEEGAHIVHLEHTGSTVISVSENAHYRWLSFDDAIQTVVSKEAAWRPLLPHLSAVLLVLKYRPSPDNILELGLGGGTLQRFFKHHFPDCHVTSIENNAQVIRQFQRWFSDPTQRYHIICGDAESEVQNQSEQDIIVIDLFSESGSPDFVSTTKFYENCLQSLNEKGLLVINLIARYQLQFEMTLDLLRKLDLNLRTFAIPGYQNKIIMAARQQLPAIQYDQELNNMAKQFELNLNAVVAML
jgi:spermidine synthase